MAWMRRLVWRMVATIVAGVIVCWLVSLAAVTTYSRRDDARQADAIVILGAAQYAGHPSPVLRARLDHALDLWQRRLARAMIVTGGKGTGDTTTEAAVSGRYLERHGVPQSAILFENHGRTTRESMKGVAALLAGAGYHTVILVSDPFHMLRLRVIANQIGMEAYTSPTATSPILPNSGERWRYILYESVKVPFVYFFERSP